MFKPTESIKTKNYRIEAKEALTNFFNNISSNKRILSKNDFNNRNLQAEEQAEETITNNLSPILKLRSSWLPGLDWLQKLFESIIFAIWISALLLQIFIILVDKFRRHTIMISTVITTQMFTTFAIFAELGRGLLTSFVEAFLYTKAVFTLQTADLTDAYEYLRKESVKAYYPITIPNFFFFLMYLALWIAWFPKKSRRYAFKARRTLVLCRFYPLVAETSITIAAYIKSGDWGNFWFIFGILTGFFLSVVYITEIFLMIFLQDKYRNIIEVEESIASSIPDEEGGANPVPCIGIAASENFAAGEVIRIREIEINEAGENLKKKMENKKNHSERKSNLSSMSSSELKKLEMMEKYKRVFRKLFNPLKKNLEVFPALIHAVLLGILLNFWIWAEIMTLVLLMVLFATTLIKTQRLKEIDSLDHWLHFIIVACVMILGANLWYTAPLARLKVITCIVILISVISFIFKLVIFGIKFAFGRSDLRRRRRYLEMLGLKDK